MIFRVVSALVRGSQCLQSTRNTSLDPLDDTRSHVTVTGYMLRYSVTLVLRLARLSIPGRLAEVSLDYHNLLHDLDLDKKLKLWLIHGKK